MFKVQNTAEFEKLSDEYLWESSAQDLKEITPTLRVKEGGSDNPMETIRIIPGL